MYFAPCRKKNESSDCKVFSKLSHADKRPAFNFYNILYYNFIPLMPGNKTLKSYQHHRLPPSPSHNLAVALVFELCSGILYSLEYVQKVQKFLLQ